MTETQTQMPASTVPTVRSADCRYCERYNRACGRHEARVYLVRSRDKYGRTVVSFNYRLRTQAVMVTLPKAYAAAYGPRYLVNFWEGPRDAKGHTPHFDFVKRADALAYAKSLVSTVVEHAEFITG